MSRVESDATNRGQTKIGLNITRKRRLFVARHRLTLVSSCCSFR